MSIYTCYEMVRDCREDRPEGWRYFISSYVPVIRNVLAHYAADDQAIVERVLAAARKPESSLFASLEPAPERWFVAELRQKILAELPARPADIEISLEDVSAALEPLTLLEKQAAWIETMRYDAQQTGAMLRMAPATVEKIRTRAAELLRGRVDAWRRSLLEDNGLMLGRTAALAGTPQCPAAKVFLDVLDGRTSWRGREELERHVATCWHCIDHFCRMAEVIELLRRVQPLAEDQAAGYRQLLGVAEKRKGWKALLGG